MIDIKELKPDEQLNHVFLGPVKWTLECAVLQHLNPDPTSIFVEYEGEPREVTMMLVGKPEVVPCPGE